MAKAKRNPSTSKERRYWLDQPGSVNKIIYALVFCCAASVVADLFYEKHAHYAVEHVIGAYGIYGFVGCVGLVLAAKEMRRLLKRDEDYYGRDD